MRDIPSSALWPTGTDGFVVDNYAELKEVWKNPSNYVFTFPIYGEREITKMVPYFKEKELFESIMDDTDENWNAPFLASENVSDLVISPNIDMSHVYAPEIHIGSGSYEFYFRNAQPKSYNIYTQNTSKSVRLEMTLADQNKANPVTDYPREAMFDYKIYNGEKVEKFGNLNNDINTTLDFIQSGSIRIEFYANTELSDESLLNVDFSWRLRIFPLKELSLSSMLPNLTQLDFVKELIFRYGLSAHKINGVFEWKMIKDILTDRANAQDWSEFFQNEIEDSRILNGFAKENLVKFTNDKSRNVAAMSLKNEHLPSEKEMFTSKYEYYEEKTPIFYKDVLNQDKTYLESINSVSYPMTLCKANYNTSSFDMSYLDGVEDSPSTTDVYHGATDERVPVLASPQSILMSTVINTYYDELRQTMDTYCEKVVRIHMRPIDFRDIRLDKLVYLRQLGSYFYINKVANYKDGYAKAYLLKIPNHVN